MQLLTQVCDQVDWLGAPVDLLVSWGAVAGGIICRTIKGFTTVTGTERVGIRCEGITPLRTQFILKNDKVR